MSFLFNIALIGIGLNTVVKLGFVSPQILYGTIPSISVAPSAAQYAAIAAQPLAQAPSLPPCAIPQCFAQPIAVAPPTCQCPPTAIPVEIVQTAYEAPRQPQQQQQQQQEAQQAISLDAKNNAGFQSQPAILSTHKSDFLTTQSKSLTLLPLTAQTSGSLNFGELSSLANTAASSGGGKNQQPLANTAAALIPLGLQQQSPIIDTYKGIAPLGLSSTTPGSQQYTQQHPASSNQRNRGVLLGSNLGRSAQLTSFENNSPGRGDLIDTSISPLLSGIQKPAVRSQISLQQAIEDVIQAYLPDLVKKSSQMQQFPSHPQAGGIDDYSELQGDRSFSNHDSHFGNGLSAHFESPTMATFGGRTFSLNQPAALNQQNQHSLNQQNQPITLSSSSPVIGEFATSTGYLVLPNDAHQPSNQSPRGIGLIANNLNSAGARNDKMPMLLSVTRNNNNPGGGYGRMPSSSIDDLSQNQFQQSIPTHILLRKSSRKRKV